MVVRNEVTRGLAENSPRHSLPIAWTQGLLSVNTVVGFWDWITKGEKCLTDAAIESASTLHESQATWYFRYLALKKQAKWSWLLRETHSVAPRPLLVTEPSVTTQRVTETQRRTIALWLDKKPCADLTLEDRFSPHSSLSEDWRPVRAHSRGSITFEQLGSTRLRTL